MDRKVSAPVGIAIVGLGRVSASHIAAYRHRSDEARIVAVCDTDAARALAIGADLGVPAFTHYERLFAEPSVDAVVLLVPHLLHHPIALAALTAGKHVSIEKPMAVTQSQCEDLIATAERRGLVLAVAENSRFVESYLEAKRILDQGLTGEIRLARGFVYGSALHELATPSEAWKRERGFGAILDAAVHFFYLFTWMFGGVSRLQAVSRHWAQGHGLPDCEVEDGAVVAGTFASGGDFSIEIALNVEVPWGERLEVYGSRGSLICDQLADPPAVLYRDAEDLGTRLASVRAAPRTWREESISRGAADFVRAVRDGRAPSVSARDAAYAVLLAERAYQSVHLGGASVEVEIARA